MNKHLIEAKDVSKIYKVGEREIRVLDSVTLEVNEGEFVAIMGASGSGKTTLLNVIGGLDEPTSGEVRIGKEEVKKLSKNRLAELRCKRIGFVFQFFNLIATMTALENVELPMIIGRQPRRQRRQRALTLLANLGLSERTNHLPSQLSGGEQQRVAIARALANNPTVLLVDEPTGNLDSKTGKDIVDILKRINKEGQTIILVTHNYDVAKAAGRIIKLRDGKIVEGVRGAK